MSTQVLFSTLLLLFSLTITTFAQDSTLQHWQITERQSIIWHPDTSRLPHSDNIELSGKKISAIIYYDIDEENNLSIEKDLIFPQLRTFNKSNEPDWKKYRAYFRRKVNDSFAPTLTCDSLTINPTVIDSIEIGGRITFYYAPVRGLQLSKVIYPAMDQRLLVEEWIIKNVGFKTQRLSVSAIHHQQSEWGYKGQYSFVVKSDTVTNFAILPRQSYQFSLHYGATLNEESMTAFDTEKARQSRDDFLQHCQDNLVLQTPDPILNTLFYFSKIRAAESIFHSSMGLVHSPGGGNYYVGIWANDQVEYSGPFFPYLGYPVGNEAAFNTYQKFSQNIPKDSSSIPYAFEVDGNFAMDFLDRGDAAMIAYGTSLYLLNSGQVKQAERLWPLIEWSLRYCHQNRNEAGAVRSESDEMEGRIPTGTANLSTSTLYYGGLKYSIPIARALGKNELAESYQKRLSVMEQVIENYFGATMEGLKTYRYFEGNQSLRHWICLPLSMGISTRQKGTLTALFEKLWTDNGILVQSDPQAASSEQMFWDRATLYALRGALKVGEKEIALQKLQQYSTKRLLGDHVPYPVEAYPENNQKHLSAESALYCRIFIEGLLGIEPLSFTELSLSPSLPKAWDNLKLQRVMFFGKPHEIELNREGENLRLRVSAENVILHNSILKPTEKIILKLVF